MRVRCAVKACAKARVRVLGIMSWALVRYPEPLAAGRVLLFALMLACGTFLFYTLHMVFIIPVFWLHSRMGVREVFWSLQHFANRPHGIYTVWVRRVLVSILPLAFISSVPVTALFEGASPGLLLHVAAVVVLPFVFMVWFWKRGLAAYSSASS